MLLEKSIYRFDVPFMPLIIAGNIGNAELALEADGISAD
jgi:hypothetical protein